MQNLSREKSLWFSPAKLTKGKDWVVTYWVENPDTGVHVRKRIKVNHIKTISERNKYAKHLMHHINEKLYSGWNPYLEELAKRGYDKLCTSMEYFLKTKKRELRPTSYRSYLSFWNVFLNWLTDEEKQDVACISFTKSDAINFSRWLLDVREVNTRTWNNHISFWRITFEWLIAEEYATINPFSDFKKKMNPTKDRVIIDERRRKMIFDYFQKHDSNMHMICLLVYHTLLRPSEIVQLTKANFSLKNQTISVSNEMSKTKTRRISTIPDSMVQHIIDWNFNEAYGSEFIFGYGMKRGRTAVNPRRIAKRWDLMRDDLKIPMSMKLYSLRDTGIVQLLNDGISPDEVMKQAGHSSLEMTTVYIKHANPTGSEQIKRRAGGS